MLKVTQTHTAALYSFLAMGSLGIGILILLGWIYIPLLYIAQKEGVILDATNSHPPSSPYLDTLVVNEKVKLGVFFHWGDEIVQEYTPSTADSLTVRHLIFSNPWIIDRFRETDYYVQAEKGIHVYDQRESVILFPGDQVRIPNDSIRMAIDCLLSSIELDINIPEFTLRILENDTIHHKIRVRVGKPGTTYLPYLEKAIQTKTVLGEGVIVSINMAPEFLRFSSGEKITHTRRDDGKLTLMPEIPALEPSIGGRRLGQLIHATTNPNTLGKAYSHGCIGTSEADAWLLYFYTTVGTPLTIRYDLVVEDSLGIQQVLDDIYAIYPEI